MSVVGQFLFAALGSICRQAELAPNLVATPGDIRQWMAYRTGHRKRATGGEGDKADSCDVPSRDPPQLARGWRAEFVGRLFDDLLAGKLSIRIADPKSDHPLAFEPSEP